LRHLKKVFPPPIGERVDRAFAYVMCAEQDEDRNQPIAPFTVQEFRSKTVSCLLAWLYVAVVRLRSLLLAQVLLEICF